MDRHEDFMELQGLIDELFAESEFVSSMRLLLLAEMRDLPEDLIEICRIVPHGTYSRQRLCDQMNSALTGHGWGRVYGTVC